MTAQRTIRLAVVIPDPGWWCFQFSRRPLRFCELWDHETDSCPLGHQTTKDYRGGLQDVPRPQSCRDATLPEPPDLPEDT